MSTDAPAPAPSEHDSLDGRPLLPAGDPLPPPLPSASGPGAPWGEVATLAAVTAILDHLFYQGMGGLSFAVAFAAVPLLIGAAAPVRRFSPGLIAWAAGLLLLSARCVWQADLASEIAGAACAVAWCIALRAGRSDLPLLTFSTPPTLLAGVIRVFEYVIAGVAGGPGGHRRGIRLALVAVPAAVCLAFAGVFLLSNPLLQEHAWRIYGEIGRWTSAWWARVAPEPERALFWGLCVLVAAGLLRPALMKPPKDEALRRNRELPPAAGARGEFFLALNTLLGVNAVFFAYNAFDAWHLLIQEALPPGLNHSQYAHQGALWLTVALAMSTFVLGAIFRGPLAFHPRAWLLLAIAAVWIAQNLALVYWVALRLDLYVGYNGLTRMRIVGMAGAALVFVGLLLVTWKVFRRKSLGWLLQRQLAALAAAAVLLAATPLDMLVWRTNVPLIQSLELPRPAVQLAVQPISPEGLACLPPLLDHPDPDIARGAAALLGRWLDTGARPYLEPSAAPMRWTRYQVAEARCARTLAQYRTKILYLIPDRDWTQAIAMLQRRTGRWI